MIRGFCLICVSLLLAACASLETGSPSPGAIPQAYSQEVSSPSASVPSSNWWRSFKDPELDRILTKVMSDNLDIGQALQNVKISQTQLKVSESSRLPALDSFVDTQLSAILGNETSSDISAELGVSSSYTVDLWGGRESAIQAAVANLEASELTVDDVKRIVTRDAALAYNELRRAEARLDLLEQSLELQNQTLSIVDARFRAGLAPALDVDRVRADLARAKSQKGLLVANKKQAEVTLSVLSGESLQPAFVNSGETNWLDNEFQSDLFVGVPADLLRKRPDVRAAEAVFARELALVGVARADLYPTLSIPGIISIGGSADDGLNDFLSLGFGASLNLPVFDGGARQAELDAQMARADSAGLAYRNAVLNAISDVEISLVNIQAYHQRVDELNNAVLASESAYAQLNALYREGLSSFLDVLDAQRNLIDSRQVLIDARATLASSVIALHTSIGFVP